MVFRLTNIRLNLDQSESELARKAAKKLKISHDQIREVKIVKKAVDARRKKDIFFVYTLDVEIDGNPNKLKKFASIPGVIIPDFFKDILLPIGNTPMEGRPVVVGAGPAGIFAALTLARYGFRPIVLERGQDVDTRVSDIEDFWSKGVLNTESNVQFGEGGAGTFSDGKLTTRINDPRVSKVLTAMVEAGAPEEIAYLNKPHIGTDKLRSVVKNLRLKLIELGGEIFFGSCVTDLVIEGEKVWGVIVNNKEEIKTDVVILAIGHSARDTYEMLVAKKVNIERKAFAIGVRIEHPQSLIDAAQYGEFAGHPKLGAADYQLVYKNEALDRACYSFCMCPGGSVVAASSEEGMVVTNGMSNYDRASGIANSALVVTVTPSDFPGIGPLAGVEFQREWEKKAFKAGNGNYCAPVQKVSDFLRDKPSGEAPEIASYRPGVTPADLGDCLPSYVNKMLREAIIAFGKKIKGFDSDDAALTGVETRTSAPVRILREKNKEASGIKGLYPAGEGAGYAGGIVSAAVDGMKAAEAVIQFYRNQ